MAEVMDASHIQSIHRACTIEAKHNEFTETRGFFKGTRRSISAILIHPGYSLFMSSAPGSHFYCMPQLNEFGTNGTSYCTGSEYSNVHGLIVLIDLENLASGCCK